MATLEELLSGTLGFFWTSVDDVEPELNTSRGYLRQVDDHIEVQTLVEDITEGPWRGAQPTLPEVLVGATSKSSVLVTQVLGRGSTASWGGGRASFNTYRAASLIVNPGNIHELRSGKVRELSIRFPGLLQWASLQADTEKWTTDPDGRVQEVTHHLKRVPDLPVASLGDGLRIRVGAHWRTDPELHGRKTITTALELSCLASGPRPVQDLVAPLEEAQYLIALAFEGWLTAGPGKAVVDTKDKDRRIVPHFWAGRLMVPPPGAKAPRDLHSPYFTLGDLGGARGLARWITLARRHPRAVEPLTRPMRSPGRGNEEFLRSVCAAIEYWVKANKSTWGSGYTKGGFYTQLQGLAKRVGRQAPRIVGDLNTWADAVWKEYNKLKHDPTAHIDPKRVALLGISARLLLEASIFDQCAGKKSVSARFANDYRIKNLPEQLASVY